VGVVTRPLNWLWSHFFAATESLAGDATHIYSEILILYSQNPESQFSWMAAFGTVAQRMPAARSATEHSGRQS